MRCMGFLLILALLALAGCEESLSDENAAPPAQAPVAQSPAAPGDPGNPSLQGAKRAAQNTADRVAQEQAELEKALEDQE